MALILLLGNSTYLICTEGMASFCYHFKGRYIAWTVPLFLSCNGSGSVSLLYPKFINLAPEGLKPLPD